VPGMITRLWLSTGGFGLQDGSLPVTHGDFVNQVRAMSHHPEGILRRILPLSAKRLLILIRRSSLIDHDDGSKILPWLAILQCRI
jgi:hypothetical protein